MLTVTESAAAHLAQMLNDAPDAPENSAIRFVPQGNGLMPTLDSERPGDTTFSHENRTVLVLDQQISELLADKTLDIKDLGQGPQLALI